MCHGATAARALKSVLQGILLSSEGEKSNSMNLLLYMEPIVVLFLIPTTLLMEENMVGITTALARDDIKIIFYLLFNFALAYCVNLTNFLVTKHTSALTLQVEKEISERREISFHRVGISVAPLVSFQDIAASHGDSEEKKNNSPEAQEKCITRLLLYHFCVNLPVMIASYPVFRAMGMRSSLPLPSWKVISTQILFYFILEDFVFYWGHRILHTKWLYKHVHSVHHEYATPFGLTSEYAHPAEILFLGFATIVGPAITGPHLITLWLWMVVRVLETVEAHCGYHFPWSLSNFLPLYGGADFHDYHHRLLYTKSGNYSSTFVYMDWIFGTDKGFRKLKALKSSEHEGEDLRWERAREMILVVWKAREGRSGGVDGFVEKGWDDGTGDGAT
ncbi:hypothetical protein TEA_030026 [Camellia sinensis var. sinensis]|uniref:Fatty acid hydroxylase domain-containing protein n=1 Tax=Camellia sinensis var. sinensis TaxID=542762 RepID=A0A4S4DV05_CAMSN|nr:hypothetical protein TEA_030026 [Camellia sinensis var. sinensis]